MLKFTSSAGTRRLPRGWRAAATAAAAALGLLIGGPTDRAHADSARVGSPAWFSAQHGAAASAGTSASPAANIAPNSPAAAGNNVARSVANFTQAARAIAKAQAAQAQAAQTTTAASTASAAAVPNGLTPGGLWVSPAITANSSAWSGASLPTVTSSAGATGAAGHTGGKIVTVNQTATTATLTWTTFNVGANTTLRFNQGGTNWTLLNLVSDPNAAPSRILGAITAPGEVLVLNPNGILFGAGSQVNVGALVASTANLAAAAFSGLTSATGTTSAHLPYYLPVFTGATAPVTVEAGASITTNLPPSAAQRGGFVLLLGQSVENDGQITTTNGQTVLAAGQDFVIRDGYGSTGGNGSTSTTLGLEVAPCVLSGTVCTSVPGTVTNTGLIQAATGDITLTGETLVQAGVLLSSTTIAQRGTIHLLTNAADTAASITFAPGSLTAIQPQDDGTTATDTARAALIAQSAVNNAARVSPPASAPLLSNQAVMPDQQYQSRIELVSGGPVEFQNGSLALSTGGQIALSAAGRVQADTGATLSVAGSISTVLPASANTLRISVQGYDLRDAPANRDSGNLGSKTVNVATGDLVQIGDLQYTGGGLLEVSGYVAGVGHSIGEWTSVGGSIALSAAEVVAQQGAVFNIAGGLVSYAAGSTANTWLIATNGKLYNINTAPSDLVYIGIYDGFTVNQPRWGISQTYNSPLIAPATTYNSGYIVGRDAGTLTIDAPTTVMEATIAAGVSTGEFQDAARTTDQPAYFPVNTAASPVTYVDPFTFAQTVVPLPGTLVIGPVIGPAPNGSTLPQPAFVTTDVSITPAGQPLASSLTVATPIPASRVGTTLLAASVLNDAALGGLTVATKGPISIDAPVTLADGGIVTLVSPMIEVSGSLTARGGQVTLGNYSPAYFSAFANFANATSASGTVLAAAVALAQGASIDTSGVFTNLAIDPATTAGQAFVNGGPVSIDTSGAVTLAAGSTISTSAGGAVLANRSVKGGTGGALSITAYDPDDATAAASTVPVTIAATLLGYGSGSVPCTACIGGALSLAVPLVSIGGTSPADAATVNLPPGFFSAGFSSYAITGQNGVTVAPGARIAVVQPIEQFTAATALTPGGTGLAGAFTVGLPALYTPNPATAVMVQRPGASITLTAGPAGAATAAVTAIALTIGAGSVISVDPAQNIKLEALGQSAIGTTPIQITVDGTLNAPAGNINVLNDQYEGNSDSLSIWLGAASVLNVSAKAVTALDTSGRPFGSVPNGGTIHLGGLTQSSGSLVADGNGIPDSTNAFIVVQPGAVLSAAGTSAMLDPAAGQNLTAHTLARSNPGHAVLVASNGGSIAFDSESGIYLGGQITAPAGGPGAQGGTFSINLVTPDYTNPAIFGFSPVVIPDLPIYQSLRTLVIGTSPASSLNVTQPGDTIPASAFGQSRVSSSQLAAGGFDVVNLTSGDAILFDGSTTLRAGRSITLTAPILGDAGTAGAVTVSAPYVTLAGTPAPIASTPFPTFDRYGLTPTPSAPSAQISQATLTVNAANIDISSSITVGQRGAVVSEDCSFATCPVADFAGFASMTLFSTGDIRLLPPSDITNSNVTDVTKLITPGSLTLIAGQIYPVADTSATLQAGTTYTAGSAAFNGVSAYNGTPLTVRAAPGPVPAAPLTAGGQLTLLAGVIDQGGVLRAPDGQITLGGPPQSGVSPTTQVVLQPNSITSVSMNGLTIPYGGTSDGTTYTVTLNGVTSTASTTGILISAQAQSGPQVELYAQTILLQSGATIDVSGGGVLAGAGFVPGRGGSNDITETPLLELTAAGLVTAPPPANNLVFAIVPGFTGSVAAPTATATAFTGPLPAQGATIAIGPGVPGLPAGTYTLLPGSDALLPGAFRVQLATTAHTLLPGTISIGNGSYLVNGYQGVANTGIAASQPIEVTVTPGAAVLADAQYNQTGYASFVLSQAALYGTPRNSLSLPADVKTLVFDFPAPTATAAALALQIQGTVSSAPGPNGLGGLVELTTPAPIEFIANAATPTPGLISVLAADVSGLNANTLLVGTLDPIANGIEQLDGMTPAVYVRDGATLSASQVFLVSNSGSGAVGGITIEPGASVTTIGEGNPSLDSSAGLIFAAGNYSVLAVSNGKLIFQPPGTLQQGGPIVIGCPTPGACGAAGPASLLSAGTILISTPSTATLDPTTRLGTAVLNLSAPVFDLGAPPASVGGSTPQASVGGSTSPAAGGAIILTASTLQSLLAGDAAAGVPPLQNLTLNATSSIDLYGTLNFNTLNPATGQSTLQTLQFNTPAIYGGTGVNASLTTGTFIWNGVATLTGAAPPGIWTPSSGTGSSLSITANTIVLGYGPNDQPNNQVSLGRLILGFTDVSLTGNQSIAGNNQGSLTVYQTATQSSTGALLTGSAGNLTLSTPLLTGAAASVQTITAGGNLTLVAPANQQANASAVGQGASLTLKAATISNNTSIVLPSGQLILNASGIAATSSTPGTAATAATPATPATPGTISLGGSSRLDLAGVATTLFDQTTYGWGGTVTLQAAQGGGVTQLPGASIDVSATNANAGSITMIAPGVITLAGTINGSASPGYTGGSFTLRAGGLGASGLNAADAATDFAALNAILDSGGVFGTRSFELTTGNLTIAAGTTVSANAVAVSIDAGSLSVAGTVNASGSVPGTIRLSAGGDLTLAAGSVLDAHATVPQLDSYGQSIDAENTASVTLTSVGGTLAIQPAAAGLATPVINVSAPPGITCAVGLCGQVTLNALRTAETSGDVQISVPAGAVTVQGAGSIAVNAFWTYAPTDPHGTIVQNNGTALTPGVPMPTATAAGVLGLAQINNNSQIFMTNAGTNAGLQANLAGLTTAPAFHLRPGVEIDSSAKSSGNLTVAGDLDLSAYRYADPAGYGRQVNQAVYGSGEPGALVIRAADGLTIDANINDGFTGAPALCQSAATCTTPYTYWELAQPLAANPDGSLALSWSIRLVAGADLAAADSRTVLPSDQLALAARVVVPGSATAADPAGSIELHDPHAQPYNSTASGASASQLPGWSVIRTGTGDLDLLAGGSVDEQSTYAIYTAGALLAANTAYELPRGTSSVPVVQSSGSLTVSIQLAAGSTTLGLAPGAVLKDPITLNTFTLQSAVSISRTDLAPVTGVVIEPATSSGVPEPVGATLVLANPPRGVKDTITVTTTAQTTTSFTVLGPDGQATNNGVTLASLISNYQAYYPQAGGNLLISAGANITGYLTSPNSTGNTVLPMDGIGDWLWRQGDGGGTSGGASSASTAWWINFGTLALPLTSGVAVTTQSAGGTAAAPVPTLTGFTGIGTLGGGNATMLAGGNIGAITAVTSPSAAYTVSQGLDVAVASTGRLAAGATTTSGIVETGGGILTIRAAGALNGGGTTLTNPQANGTLTDTRGAIDVLAASIGQIALTYGQTNAGPLPAAGDPRAGSPLTASLASAQGGPTVVPGDATVSLSTRGDLVLGGVGDPTREDEQNLTPDANGAATGLTWFSLWQSGTAVNLGAAGGNLVVSTQTTAAPPNAPATDNRFVYPPTLIAVATSGSIYAGDSLTSANAASSIELAPSATGQLELLAGRSIFGNALKSGTPQSFDISGASTALLPTPLNPAFDAINASGVTTATNTTPNISASPQPRAEFAFEADTATGTLHAGDPTAALIYAGADIVDLWYGETLNYAQSPSVIPQKWYVSGKLVRVMAGGDVVEFGTIAGQTTTNAGGYTSTSGLILNNNPTDVSVIQAGGEILYANATVAGPGQLYLQAGGNVYQGSYASLQSLGPINANGLSSSLSRTGGAGITVLAGVGTAGPNWPGFAQTYLAPGYLDPVYLEPNDPTTVTGYAGALLDYLGTNYGYTGSTAGAAAFFEALPIAQQRAFLLQIYFDELDTSDKQFGDPTSPHYKSYVEGKTAVATLFPAGSTASGGITLFGGSGISTDFGGPIVLLTPDGVTSLGNTTPPPVPVANSGVPPAGVLTQGTGDVDIYAYGSIILGQSRVFTDFGGNIVMWSATGDINAGNGIKSTQLVSVPATEYDTTTGLITLLPGIPTSGAGIATLAPIPGTPAADVDLVAPEGIIDAGEAGIRVSGNANLAALSIVNAANIQVTGKSVGLPTVVVPNVSALSAASAVAAAAAQAGQQAAAAAGAQNQAVPSTITVDVIGFGP